MDKRTFHKVDDFDVYAKDYRAEHTKNIKVSGADSLYFAEFKIKHLKNFEENKAMTVLDIGCGDGAVEFFIQQHFSHWHTIGVDVSAQSIAIASARNLTHAQFKWFDGLHLPFEKESVSVVFIANVLHHINFNDHLPLLQEIYRVLKPNGRFYIYEHNPKNPVTRHFVKTCIFDEHAVLLNPAYLKNVLIKAGFKIKTCNYLLFFPRNRIFSVLHFLEKYLRNIPFGAQYFTVAVKK